MKKINKIRWIGASTIIPAIVSPIAVLASCGKEDNEVAPVFTYNESKEIDLKNRTKFQVIFDSDKELTEEDTITATAVDVQAPGTENITFVYNQDQSLGLCEGKKAVFDATVENAKHGSHIEFNIKLNYSKNEDKVTSEQLFEGFITDCQFIDGNITIVDGQEDLLTQPQTPVQYYKFNLNDTQLEKDDKIEAAASIIYKTDNIERLDFVYEHYIEGNNLYLCFAIVPKDGAELTELDYVDFKFSVTCTNGNQILWVNKFGDDQHPFRLEYCKKPGIVPKSEWISGVADHDAGSDEQKLRFYVADAVGKQNKPTFEISDLTTGYSATSAVQGNEAILDENTGFYYWPVSIKFTGDLSDEPKISYKLKAQLEHYGEFEIGNLEFDYVSSKMNEMDKKEQRTYMGSHVGRFDCTLIKETDMGPTDHLNLEVISTSESNIVPVRAHTTADRRGTQVWFEVKLTSPSLMIHSREFGTFNAKLTCSTSDGVLRWREDFNDLKLTQFNNPLNLVGQNKEQYVDFDATKEEFSYTWNYKVDEGVEESSIDDITWTPNVTSKSGDVGVQLTQGAFDPSTNTLPVTAKITGKPLPNDYVKFAMQAESNDTEWPWTYSEDGFMLYLWGGYWLSRNTTIKYSVKEYPQHALSCEYVDDIPAGTSPGMAAIVNVDTSAWDESQDPWPGDYWKWIFALPKDPDKGFGEGYWPVNMDKVVVTVTDPDETVHQLTRTTNYNDLQKEPYLFFVSESGPITTSKWTIQKGSKITYRVELGGDQDITKKTRFYFTYHN